MTASAGAWYRVGTVNVTAGSQSVTGVGTNWQNDVISIAIGDIFTIDAKTWYEVTVVNSDTSITIDRDFEGNTANGESYAIVRSTSGTILTRIAGQVSVQFNQKQLFIDELRTWLNSDNASEELTDSHGVKQSIRTPAQMVRDHDNKLAELDAIHPYPWAIRIAEFEARRAANNKKFAASGFVFMGQHTNFASHTPINQGLISSDSTGNFLLGGNVNNLLGNTGDSQSLIPVITIAGIETEIESISYDDTRSLIKFPPPESGLRTYNTDTGESFVHASSSLAFASETATNKVVISRVDTWGFEGFLREINDADPFVYKKGCIQSQAAKLNGITTVDDNVRPNSYFAWFIGDTTTRGKGINWQTATEAQRVAIASDPKNNIRFDDSTGKFYQWCVRGRSFAGIGNGDWDAIDASSPANLTLRQQPVGTAQRISPQGILDSAPTSGDGSNYFSNTASEYNLDPYTGIFTSRRNDLSAKQESVFFLVCGTKGQFNTGAYHPSFNPLGVRAWNRRDGGGNTPFYLYKDFDGLDGEMSTASAFQNGRESSLDGIGYAPSSGFLNSTGAPKSGRIDGRFCDSAYDSAQGGMCRDMRYSAWGVNSEDFAKTDLEIKTGKYRGREVLTSPLKTDIQPPTSSYYVYFDNQLKPDICLNNALGEIVYLRVTSNSGVTFSDSYSSLSDGLWHKMIVADVNGRPTLIFDGVSPNIGLLTEGTAANLRIDILLTGSSCGYIHPELSVSVAGSFEVLELVGDPNNIFLCDDFKEGWIGYLNPKVPTGATEVFTFSRIVDESFTRWGSTNNQGASWSIVASEPSGWDAVNNTRTSNKSTSNVYVYYYNTKAKMVKPTVQTPIYGREKGIGKVWASCSWLDDFGRQFGFSLINKVLTESSTAGELAATCNLKRFSHRKEGLLDWNLYRPTQHESINLKYLNGECGVKALNLNVAKNQQGFIEYAYTELKHNGVDWGDDDKIHFANNQTTMPDENGNTVLVGASCCVESIGWIKNDK